MPSKRFFLYLFILFNIVILTYQSSKGLNFNLAFLNNIFSSIYKAKTAVVDFIHSPIRKIYIIEKENERLKTEVERLLQLEQKYLEAIQENKSLKGLLSIKEKERRYVTSAHVIGRNMGQWNNVLVLDKGLSDGVSKDMVAINERGLAGKITEVYGSYSNLLLVTDINFSVSVRLQESRTEGVVSGTGFRKCKLKYIPSEVEVKNGEIVVTSGLDRLFPQGIPVGYVSRVNKYAGLFQDIDVVPFIDNRKLEFVAIIKQ